MPKENKCADCDKPISKKATRCKSCKNRYTWSNPNDPRRQKLIERNESVRNGNAPYKEREWLRERYEDRNMSLRNIAKEANCVIRTIARWMKRHEIPVQDNVSAIRTRRKKLIGPKSPRWRGGPPPCPSCGGKMSRSCRGTCMKCRDTSGKKSSNWQEVADVMVLMRSWAAFHWRPLVFERDSYTCQQCGDNHGHNLAAHHIRPLAKIVQNELKQGTYPIDTPEQRLVFVKYLTNHPLVTSTDNGITLCKKCHRIAHYFFICAFGETKSIAEWLKDSRCVVNYSSLHNRITNLKWLPEKAILTPKKRYRN